MANLQNDRARNETGAGDSMKQLERQNFDDA